MCIGYENVGIGIIANRNTLTKASAFVHVVIVVDVSIRSKILIRHKFAAFEEEKKIHPLTFLAHPSDWLWRGRRRSICCLYPMYELKTYQSEYQSRKSWSNRQ